MDAYIGTILPVAFNFAPKNWALCDGSTLQISQNQALYALIGTKYGGNGTTTFQLPNLQGRIPVSFGTYNKTGDSSHTYNIGDTGGTLKPPVASHTHMAGIVSTGGIAVSGNLLVSQNPASSSAPATSFIPAAAVAANDPNGGDLTVNLYAQNTGSNNVAMNAVSANIPSFTPSVTIANSSSGTSNMQPFLVVYYIICVIGYYPPRP